MRRWQDWRFLGLTAAGLGAVLVAALISVSGPDMDYVPAMAPRPVERAGGRLLYVQAHEVTIAEWNRCHEAGACSLALRVPDQSDGADWPATGLNWLDVNEIWSGSTARRATRSASPLPKSGLPWRKRFYPKNPIRFSPTPT